MLIGMLLFVLQTSLFLQFKETYLETEIKERSFVKGRPFYVKALKVENVCCSRYHVELDMLRKGFDTLRSLKGRVHIHADCRCNCEVVEDRLTTLMINSRIAKHTNLR